MSNENEPKQAPVNEPTPKKKPNEMVDENTPMRRVRFLIINPADFLMLFTKGIVFAKRTKLIEGVPEDALIMGMNVDHVRGGIILVVQSKEYDEVPMTVMPPVQHVSIQWGVEKATKKKKK